MDTSLLLSIVFLLIYVAVAWGIGIVSARRESEEDFMIANRDVHGIQTMATMAAGWFDGVTLSVYLGYLYLYGVSALSLFIGISFGFLLFRCFASRIKKNADKWKAYSMPEYFLHVLGKRNAILFSLFLIVQFFGYLVINFILSGKVLSQLLPFLPYPFAVVIGAAIILIYLLLAGFKAVVKTDFFQLLIMITMVLVAAIFFASKVRVTQGDLDVTRMGIGNIVGFFVLAGFGVMVAPDIWQRVFATRDDQTLKRGLVYTAIILPVLAVVIGVVGLATKQNLADIEPEDALIAAFRSFLPLVVKEFALALLYAVSLSSSDTVTFVVASIITRDLKNYTTRFTDESMSKMTRVTMVAFVAVAALLAISFQQITHIALSLGSLNLALFPVVISSIYFSLHRGAVFWSLIVVILSVLGLSLGGSLSPETAALSLPVAAVSLFLFEVCCRLVSRVRGSRT